MKARRAGHGCSTGIASAPGPRADDRARPERRRFWRLVDVPGLAAALDRARLDVRAHEQTEAYWRLTWSEQ